MYRALLRYSTSFKWSCSKSKIVFQAVDALRNSPIIAQLVVEKCTAEDHLTNSMSNSSGPPTPQGLRYGAVHYNQYQGHPADTYNGEDIANPTTTTGSFHLPTL